MYMQLSVWVVTVRSLPAFVSINDWYFIRIHDRAFPGATQDWSMDLLMAWPSKQYPINHTHCCEVRATLHPRQSKYPQKAH